MDLTQLTPDQLKAINSIAPVTTPTSGDTGGPAPNVSATQPVSGGFSALSGATPPTPPAPPTTPGGIPLSSGSFGDKLGAAVASAGIPAGNMGWARALVHSSLVARASNSVGDVLNGLGDAAAVNTKPGEGPLKAVAQVLQARGQRIADQKQQDFNNQLKTHQEQREDQRDQFAQAQANRENYFRQKAISMSADAKIMDQNIADDKKSFDASVADGAEVLAQDIPAHELQASLANKSINSVEHSVRATGKRIVGKDADGEPIYEMTYSVLGSTPQRKFTPEEAAEVNAYTNHDIPEGSVTTSHAHDAIYQEAQSAKYGANFINTQRKALGLDPLTPDEIKSNSATLQELTRALSFTGNDPVHAIDFVTKDQSVKDPHAADILVNMYGGPDKFAKMKIASDKAAQDAANAALEAKNKAEEKGKTEGKAAGPNGQSNQVMGNTDLTGNAYLASLPSDHQAVVKQIASGQMPLQQIQRILTKQPGLINEVAIYDPKFDGSKIGGYVKASAEFTSGKPSIALNSANTTLAHLKSLQESNDTPGSFIPSSRAYAVRQTALNDASTELARFLNGGAQPSEKEIASARASLDPDITVLGVFPNVFSDVQAKKKAVVSAQAERVNEKLKEYESQWAGAQPSSTWNRPMPGLSPQGRDAYESITGNRGGYAGGATVGSAATTGQPQAKIPPAGATATVKGSDGNLYYTNQQGQNLGRAN